MIDSDHSQELQEDVRAAMAQKTPLRIVGGDTKAFYGRESEGRPLNVGGHRGVIVYEPSELVITARTGTPLTEVEALLAQHGQMLAFEPPYFGAGATLGGTIACGFSGPRRPYSGAARDFVLGVKCLNGKAETLNFGGRVMKNVAGYDVSRLMVGALGTLGILLEVSLKVLPRPACERTVMLTCDEVTAIDRMNAWAATPLPLSAACFHEDRVYIRLSGTEQGVRAAAKKIGGEVLSDDARFWQDLREQRHRFFSGTMPLWRLSVAPAAAPLALSGNSWLDWGGAQRWLKSDAPAHVIRAAAAQVGGHATLFRGGDRRGDVMHSLPGPLASLHNNLKQAFDPRGIFNVGRMYASR